MVLLEPGSLHISRERLSFPFPRSGQSSSFRRPVSCGGAGGKVLPRRREPFLPLLQLPLKLLTGLALSAFWIFHGDLPLVADDHQMLAKWKYLRQVLSLCFAPGPASVRLPFSGEWPLARHLCEMRLPALSQPARWLACGWCSYGS